MATIDADSAIVKYDERAVKGIVNKIKAMATCPAETAYTVIKNPDMSWASIISAQLFVAMYEGNIKACRIMLDRLDGKQVKEMELITSPVEIRKIKPSEISKLPDTGVVRLGGDLVPRNYQVPILKAFDNGIKRFCIVQTRRSGKTWLLWRLMIREAIKKKANYLYVFNSEKQLKESLWEAIDNNGVNFIDFVPKELVASIQEGDFRITLKNGSTIRLMLGSTPDSLRGANPYGIVLDEYATLDPTTIQVLTPILESNGGWLVATGTPRGDNHFKKLYDAAKNDKDWYVHSVNALQSGLFSQERLNKLRQESIDFYGNEAYFQQEYMCFTPGTFISTESGGKNIEDIRVGDIVLTHRNRVRRVTDTMARDYCGKMVRITVNGGAEPLTVTPNHPFRVYDLATKSYSWKDACDLTKNDYLCSPKRNSLPSVSNKAFIELCGWYITEGSSSRTFINIDLGAHEEEYIENVCQNCDILGLSYIVNTANNCSTIQIKDTGFADSVVSLCGSHAKNKHIPFSIIGGFEQELLQVLVNGDGCDITKHYKMSNYNKFKAFNYTTISRQLAYDITQLGIMCGYRSSSYIKKQYTSTIMGREVNLNKVYCVDLKKELTPAYYKLNGTLIRRIRNTKLSMVSKISKIEEVYYSGNVYNFSVSMDESYVANGLETHNCSWISPNSGSVFGELTNAMLNKGHFKHLPYDKDMSVYTAWDIGNSDHTAIVFFQINKDQDVHVIDLIEASRAPGGVDWFVKEIAKKGYAIQQHFLPFDADYHKGAQNETYIGELKKLGVRNCKVLKRVSTVTDKVNFLRGEFKRLFIDDKLDRIVECLRGMEYEWSDAKQTWSSKPSHKGGYIDVVDALCYMAQASRDIDGDKPYSGGVLKVQHTTSGLYGFSGGNSFGKNNRGYMF